jgi:hypothetical protein
MRELYRASAGELSKEAAQLPRGLAALTRRDLLAHVLLAARKHGRQAADEHALPGLRRWRPHVPVPGLDGAEPRTLLDGHAAEVVKLDCAVEGLAVSRGVEEDDAVCALEPPGAGRDGGTLDGRVEDLDGQRSDPRPEEAWSRALREAEW